MLAAPSACDSRKIQKEDPKNGQRKKEEEEEETTRGEEPRPASFPVQA